MPLPQAGVPTDTLPAPLVTPTIMSPVAGPTDTPGPEPSPIASLTPTPAPTPTATPDVPLSAGGPWLVFSAAARPSRDEWSFGLYAVNPDGTGLTQLVGQPVLPFYGAEQAVSPQGRQFAFITSSDPFGAGELVLNILTLPGGEIRPVAALTPEGYTAGRRDSEPAFTQAMASIEQQTAAWNPRGTHLAFLSAHEGPSADLYLYGLYTRQVTRLSDEPGQAVAPVWSPDGKYLAFGVVDEFGVRRRSHVDEIWVAWTGGGGTRPLIELTVDAAEGGLFNETIVGWSGPQTLVVAAWDDAAPPACGRTRLREVDVLTGERRALWQGTFQHAALDAGSGAILVVASNAVPGCAGESGLFLLRPRRTAEATRIGDLPGPAQSAVWSAAQGAFTVAIGEYGQPTTQLLTVSLTGEISAETVAPGLYLSRSPGGDLTAWYGSQPEEVAGLWVGPTGGLPEPVFGGPVSAVTWSPDGQSLFFFRPPGVSGYSVYVARQPGFIPVPLTEHMLPGSFVWVPGSAH